MTELEAIFPYKKQWWKNNFNKSLRCKLIAKYNGMDARNLLWPQEFEYENRW